MLGTGSGFRRLLGIDQAKLSFEQAHFLEELESALGLFLIHTGYCKPNMHQHIVADRSFGHEIEANLTHDSAKINATAANSTLISRIQELSRYR
ncbi:MAG: hypothetical protein WA405_01355 [Candidatus Acidiferrales bacterium]